MAQIIRLVNVLKNEKTNEIRVTFLIRDDIFVVVKLFGTELQETYSVKFWHGNCAVIQSYWKTANVVVNNSEITRHVRSAIHIINELQAVVDFPLILDNPPVFKT